MEQYYVNRNAQDTPHREHEVHRTHANCPKHAAPQNQEDLGMHATCRSALHEAESRGFRPADGCAFCVPDCHST
jgi:hypothetical protein